MNRKNFLSLIMAAGGALPGFAGFSNNKIGKPGIIPPYLQPGDAIGITSPAGYITIAEIRPAVQLMESWGFVIKTGDTIGKRDFSLGGTDEERIADFQHMLDDKSLKAIMCARGGYGSIRIIDKLNFTTFVNHPKWIIGFSDITVVHCHLDHNYRIASIHSKMCNSFPDNWALADAMQAESILSIKNSLNGTNMHYSAVPDVFNLTGSGEGKLIGGNLKTIETLAGTKSSLRAAGKILFVEDTGEYLYSIDRMFWNLQRTGQLADLKGLIVGGFKIKPDDPGEEFGRTLQEIVLEKVKDFHYPVCFNFPVGHQKNNYALKCGVDHRLLVTADNVTLTEI